MGILEARDGKISAEGGMMEWLQPFWFIPVILFLLCFVWIIWHFRNRRKSIQLSKLHESNLAYSYGRVISELSFEDALNANHSSMIVKEKMLDEINAAIGSRAADGTVVSLEVVRSAEAQKLILAKFSETTARQLKAGSAVQLTTKNGQKMLIAIDKNGHKIVEHAKQVDPSYAAKISQVATLIVGAAHIIAGYDNAKKLSSLDKKMDRLIARIKNQSVAKLAEVYETLKGDLLREDHPDEKSSLRDLQRTLRELRNIWLAEIRDDLKIIRNPRHRFFLSRWFSRNNTTASDLKNQVMQQQESLHYVRLALQLEQVICEILGQGMAFENIAIPEVKRQMKVLAELVAEREGWIRELVKESPENELIALYENFEKSLK